MATTTYGPRASGKHWGCCRSGGRVFPRPSSWGGPSAPLAFCRPSWRSTRRRRPGGRQPSVLGPPGRRHPCRRGQRGRSAVTTHLGGALSRCLTRRCRLLVPTVLPEASRTDPCNKVDKYAILQLALPRDPARDDDPLAHPVSSEAASSIRAASSSASGRSATAARRPSPPANGGQLTVGAGAAPGTHRPGRAHTQIAGRRYRVRPLISSKHPVRVKLWSGTRCRSM